MFRLFYFCAFLGFLCTAVSSADAHLYFLPDYNNAVLFGTNVPHNPNTVENQCPNIGYSVTSCPAGQFLFDRCPLSALYYRTCKNNSDLCLENGYVTSCPVGRVTDEVCPEDGNYFTCKCAPCEGYNYTYAQATSAGYVVDGIGCQSCDEMKYKRKDNPCVGYNYDISNCGVSECGTLSGATCQSGLTVKYAECKACPAPTCSDGEWNLDTYWCDGALKCLLPEK